MVRHIVSWRYKDDVAETDKPQVAAKIKAELEALPPLIDGLIELNVCETLPGSSGDIMLNSLLTDEAALAEYQKHPAHVKAATYVRSMTQGRVCLDYFENLCS